MSKNLQYVRPLSSSEATTLLASHTGSRVIAGGTDLLVRWKNGLIPELTYLIDLTNLDLGTIKSEGDRITIGSACTLTQIVEHPVLREKFPALVGAAVQVGSLQIRNLATLGGNTANASPAGDTIPALMTLDAVVVLQGIGESRRVSLDAFFTGPGKTVTAPGEFIEAFEIPDRMTRGTFKKLGERMANAISKVSLALSIWNGSNDRHSYRIALGAVAPTVIRCRRSEALLEGISGKPTPQVISQACELASEEATPIDDLRSNKTYRKKMAGVLLRQALEEVGSGTE